MEGEVRRQSLYSGKESNARELLSTQELESAKQLCRVLDRAEDLEKNGSTRERAMFEERKSATFASSPTERTPQSAAKSLRRSSAFATMKPLGFADVDAVLMSLRAWMRVCIERRSMFRLIDCPRSLQSCRTGKETR